MTHYLVTGASGLLGLNLSLWLSKENRVTGIIHRNELKATPFDVIVADLAQRDESARQVDRIKPDAIIHTAAMAIVDECEKQPERALRVNAEVPGEMADVARKLEIPFLHISTDAVFDGKKGAYSEEDDAVPINVYARSKLLGEKLVSAANPSAIIARVNFYGWSLRGDRSLAEMFVRELSARRKVKGFTDVYFSSLYVMDLAAILKDMLEKGLKGVYHTVSREALSKYEFALKIAKRFGFDENLIAPVSVDEAGLSAARSPNLALNVEKIERQLGRKLPGQDQGIERFHESWACGDRQRIHSFLREE